MWYVITAAAGLLLGLGLLIWGLRERSQRHKAELHCKDYWLERRKLETKIQILQRRSRTERIELERSHEALDRLRTILDVARTRLMKCQDPRTVKLWLDGEMQDNKV